MTTDIKITQQDDNWDMVISPQRSLLDLRLGDLWRYKDLVLLFVRRDFVAAYKQTILGPLWYLIQPILTALTFTVIFGNIASLPTDGLPPFLFYMAGNIIWSYFSSCLNSTANTFTANAGLFGKVYFPRLAVPISILISQLISFLIQFGMFLAFLLYFIIRGSTIQPDLFWLSLSPILILMMAGLGLGFGLIISSVTTKYRDLRFLVGFGMNLLMYATPVIYPISFVPERFQWIILVNPITPIVEGFRKAFLGEGAANINQLLYSFGFMSLLLIIGVVIFNRVEQTFMDTV